MQSGQDVCLLAALLCQPFEQVGDRSLASLVANMNFAGQVLDVPLQIRSVLLLLAWKHAKTEHRVYA